MEALSPAYVVALAGQMGFLSAFMGGFAATMMVMLMSQDGSRRAVNWSSALSAVAAIAFIITAVTTTTLVMGSHPDAPTVVARGAANGPARIMVSLFFVVGVYALIAAIGCAGWVRSRRMGWTTTALASLGVLATTLNFVSA